MGRCVLQVCALRHAREPELAQGTMSEGAKRPSRMVEAAGVELLWTPNHQQLRPFPLAQP